MDNEPGTSIEADKNLAASEDCWTTNLKNISEFSYQKFEEHLVHDAKKNADSKPAEAFKHKSSGYRLLTAGYSRQFVVKPNVKKGDKAIYFLVRCHVFAEMRKKQYIVYVHLDQSNGDVAFAKCSCPGGTTCSSYFFQLLDYIELGLV